jgi:hypothetical protein
MKRLIIALALLTPACAAGQARQTKIDQFKHITKDLCIESPSEVLLAQHLYIEMMVVKTFRDEKE